jgi:signal transduction histidine kinase
LLGLILDQLKRVIDYTGCAILTVEGEDLVFLDHRNPVPQESLMQLRLPVKHLGRLWETLRAREAIIVPDLLAETPLAQAVRVAMGDPRETAFQYVRAWMAVPLILRDQVIGMLVLTSSEEQAFTERHATLALAIANQAAIAIENARLYEQAQALAALEERQKLARELHDSVSQALYSIALGVHTARTLLDRDPALVAEPLDDLLALAKAGLAEMRALIFELRPESLETEGLVSALTKQGEALQARYEVAVHLDLGGEPDLPLSVKQELYRIAQEALHNTVKHAQARQVDLCLHQTQEAVLLEVRDDGVGFDPAGAFPGHLGLHSMRERVRSLGGTLQIESAPDEGTRLCAHVPRLSPA